MQKLSNDQLAERTREANRRRSERQRAKRMEAGRVAFTCWLPTALQKQIVDMATAESVTTSTVAERLLIAGINSLAEPARADSVDAQPADASAFNRDLGAFKLAIIDAWNGGMRGYGPIATELTSRGFRNGNGNPYSRSHVKAVLVKAGLVNSKEATP